MLFVSDEEAFWWQEQFVSCMLRDTTTAESKQTQATVCSCAEYKGMGS